MKRLISIIAVFLCVSCAYAQKDVQDIKYRRSSIYSVLISHSGREFEKDIMDEFLNIPVPEKYNDHDLNVKVLRVADRKLTTDEAKKLIDNFIDKNNLASHMVARWYDRNIIDGACSINTLNDRAANTAMLDDIREALATSKGQGSLKGTIIDNIENELINSTFLIVNDIRYIDRAKGSAIFGAVLNIAGAAMGAVEAAKGNRQKANAYQSLGQLTGAMAASYKGFKCKVNTYLYRLVWDETASGTFNNEIYDEEAFNQEKMTNFDKYKTNFKLEYIGMQESSGSNTSFLGINENHPQIMVRKACQRAIDENVANLQKNFDVFKVKTPLHQIDEKTFKAEIGLKEGINRNTKFEVLEPEMKKDGSIVYKRVGVVKPASDKIWDNRFMAVEEGAVNADLAYTVFSKVSGSEFYDGMLIRQIK